jgi:hypothetical protein
MLEANDLKSFIINNYMSIDNLVSELNPTQHSNENETENVSTSSDDNQEPDVEDLLKMPFESIQKKLSQKFEEKFKTILNSISNRTFGLAKKTHEEELSLSTINLSETKTTSGGLNDTFTIKSGLRTESSIASSSQSSINSSDGVMDPIKADQIAINIYNERMRLAEEKRLFYEEKLRIEQEAKYQRNVSLKLEKTVSVFNIFKRFCIIRKKNS